MKLNLLYCKCICMKNITVDSEYHMKFVHTFKKYFTKTENKNLNCCCCCCQFHIVPFKGDLEQIVQGQKLLAAKLDSLELALRYK